MRGAVAVMLLMFSMLLPAAASADVRSATLQDEPDDGNPNLVSAAVTYDTGGSAEARVTFAAPPPSGTSTVALVALGSFSGSTCEEVLLLGAHVDARDGSSFQRADETASVTGPARVEGATLVMSGAGAAMADESIDCAFVLVNGSPSDFIRAQELEGPPPPPPAPDPPDPPEPEDPVPPKPKATPLERYDAAAAKCRKRSGKARRTCLKRAAKANQAGARLARKRAKNPFLGKAFVRTDFDPVGACGGQCVSAWIFSDDKWVHRGVPEDGPAVARCKKVTATGDKDGCLRYRLSKDGRTATVGKAKLKLKAGKLIQADKPKQPFARVAVPGTGARHDAALSHISSFGIPGVNQSFFTSQLYLDRDGRFTTASQASGTNNQGSDFENSYTVLGADQKGRYAFEPGGTLALFFESGKVTRRSALVLYGDDDKLGTVSRDGLFLDGAVYLPEDD